MKTITVDRLKPAQLDLGSPVEVAQSRPKGSSSHQGNEPTKVKQPSRTNSPHHTRSGRLINLLPCYIPGGGEGSIVADWVEPDVVCN